MQRTFDPLREFRQDTGQSSALGVELTGQQCHIFAQALLESIESVQLIFGARTRFGHDLSRTLLRGNRHLSGSRFGFLLRLIDELLSHGDHGGHLLSPGGGARDGHRGGCRGGGRGRCGGKHRCRSGRGRHADTTLELTD
ncbi:MAG: hypothetical protein B7Z74_06895, partial [Deltaproteobacteria bacterium 21-66-5]